MVLSKNNALRLFKATFYCFITDLLCKTFITHAHGIFPALIHPRPYGLFFRLQALKNQTTLLVKISNRSKVLIELDLQQQQKIMASKSITKSLNTQYIRLVLDFKNVILTLLGVE